MAELIGEHEEILLTQEGYDLKKKQLEEYRHKLYEELPKRLKTAKEHGGELRENKEFIDLQNEKEFYETEVRRLEELLDRAKIIAEDSISNKEVSIGNWVTLKNLDSDEEIIFELVDPAEADLEANKISTQSPLGKALKGQKRGAEVELETPGGKSRYKVVGIRRRN